MKNAIIVRAVRDEEAGVWVASTSDVPGLAAEAASLEELKSKVLPMLADLNELNGVQFDLAEIPVHFIAEQSARIADRASPDGRLRT